MKNVCRGGAAPADTPEGVPDVKLTKRICGLVLALILLGCFGGTALAANHPFTDVPVGCWYEGDVEYVYTYCLMNGVGNRTFAPEMNMSRAMLVTVLYRLEGSPEVEGETPFTDLQKGAFYVDAVAWAYENGIVKGVSETAFDPNRDIDREQTVTIFARYAAFRNVHVDTTGDLSGFEDGEKVSSFALESVQWAVKIGLINGTSPTTLTPQGTATRAQCAAILQRFITWGMEHGLQDWEIK